MRRAFKKLAVIICWILLASVVIDLTFCLPYRDAHRLIDAIEEGNLTGVEALLESGADPNTATGPYKGVWRYINSFAEHANEYPLCVACRHGELEMVELLLEYGADPLLTQDEDLGWSALESAILGSRHPDSVRILELLLEHGADPERTSNFYHPVYLAAMEYPLDIEGAEERIVEMVKILMGDIDVNACDGLTMLMQAAIRDNLALTEYLLSIGADPMIQTEEGMTALDYAVSRGHEDVANVLKNAMQQ